MVKLSKIILAFCILGLELGCAQVLQNVQLQINTKDDATQEKFNVIEKTLTIKEARAQNLSVYNREVLQSGRGENARPIPEKLAIKSNFPDNFKPRKYRIGKGDILTLSRLIENNRLGNKSKIEWPKKSDSLNYQLGIGDTLTLTLIRQESLANRFNSTNDEENQNFIVNPTDKDETINSTGRIGSDGSVLLLEVGRLEAEGKTLNELRSEVRNILIRNGVSPRFQLEISEFKSKRAYLTINSTSEVIFLEDQKTTLKDILTSANVGFKLGIITQVTLQRDRQRYLMDLYSIFNEDAPEIAISAGDHIFVNDSAADVLSTISTVGHDGNVVFAGVGKIRAVGLTIDELHKNISKLMEKIPDSENSFQVVINEFASQTALISIPEVQGGVIQIRDKPLALDEALTEFGLSVSGDKIIRINLWRGGKSYTFTLNDLLESTKNRVFVQPNDLITIEILPYKENKVFILGGVNPQILKINPLNRETLADILFTNGGTLASSGAKRSEVYLLRGTSPVIAYHLDAQSPTRLIVADTMELRPNDILYVAEQPIISFNRALATIVPLRILLRDIQDENIP